MRSVSFILFLFTLLFAPLAFGSVELWSLTVMQVAVCLTLLCFAVSLFSNPIPLRKIPGILPFSLVICWMALQLVPLPLFLVKLLAPGTYGVYEPVGLALENWAWSPLSVNVERTLTELVRVGCYFLFYIVTVQLLSHGRRLRVALNVVVAAAVLIAFAAILQKLSSPDKIFWFRQVPRDVSNFFGPWINRSQYAGFMGMIFPLLVALFFFYRPVVRHEESLKARIVSFFDRSGSDTHFILGLGAFIIFSSVFLSLSRGGMISISLSLLCFLLCLGKKRIAYSRSVLVVSVILLVMGGVLFGWEPVVERINSTVSPAGQLADGRLLVWRDSLAIMWEFFLTGSGFGTFLMIFPKYKTFADGLVYDHAHNDYIELFTDGGIIGFVLVGWFVWAVISSGWKMMLRRRDNFSVLVTIGALSGLCAMLVHSVTDFNFHNGADGLYFFFLCGIVVAASHTRFHHYAHPSLLAEVHGRHRYSISAAGLLALMAVLWVQGGGMVSRYHYAKTENIYISRQLSPEKTALVRAALQDAAQYSPFDGRYPFFLGNVESQLGNPDKARHYYSQAARLNPLEGVYLNRLASTLPAAMEQQSSVLMEQSYKRALNKNRLVLSWAEWLVWSGNKEQALTVLQEALPNNESLLFRATPMLLSNGVDFNDIRAILPASLGGWVQYGSYLNKLRYSEAAAQFYQGALQYLDTATAADVGHVRHLYSYFLTTHDEEMALTVLRQATEQLPEQALFHDLLGDYYLDRGITYRAREEYQQAILLEPDNERYRRKFRKLDLQIQ